MSYMGALIDKPAPAYQGAPYYSPQHSQQGYANSPPQGAYYPSPHQSPYPAQNMQYVNGQPQSQPQMIFVQRPQESDSASWLPCACLTGCCAALFCCPCWVCI